MGEESQTKGKVNGFWERIFLSKKKDGYFLGKHSVTVATGG